MRDSEHGSLGRRGAACERRAQSLVWGRREERRAPLVQEVSVGVDDIGLREFMFDQGDDVREVGLAGVLTVDD